MQRRYHRKCLKWCSIAIWQRRSGYTGAFFLWKNNTYYDKIISIILRRKELVDMFIKRKNIKSGLLVAFVALGIYLLFLSIKTETLISIGNGIEGIFGVCSDFDVEIFREAIKTITSGIFGSALVAVLFYIQEYNRMKIENIREIIAIGRELCEKFDVIPSFAVGNEEAILKKEYYLEYKQNKAYREAIEKSKEICEKARKEHRKDADTFINEVKRNNKRIEEMISTKAENDLICFWEKVGRTEDWISERRNWLIDEYDKLILKSKNCYIDILSIDLHSLRDVVNSFDSARPMLEKQKEFIRKRIPDKYILGELGESNYSAKDIAERILNILERAKALVAYTFEKNCVDIEYATNVQLIDSIMELQNVFIRQTEIDAVRGGKNGECLLKLSPDYKVMRYHMENLFAILMFEFTGKYDYQGRELFIRPDTRYSTGTFLTTVITDMETTLNMLNIYR